MSYCKKTQVTESGTGRIGGPSKNAGDSKKAPPRGEVVGTTRNKRHTFGKQEIARQKEKEDQKSDRELDQWSDPVKTRATLEEKSRQLYTLQFKLTLCKSELANKDQELQRQKACMSSLKDLHAKKNEAMIAELEECNKAVKETMMKHEGLLLQVQPLQERLVNLEATTEKKLSEQRLQITDLMTRLATKEKQFEEAKRELEEARESFKEELKNYRKKVMENQASTQTSSELETKGNPEDYFADAIKLGSQALKTFQAASSSNFDIHTTGSPKLSISHYHGALIQMSEALLAVLQASKNEIALMKGITTDKVSDIQMLKNGGKKTMPEHLQSDVL
jgi:flagellar hook-basal body complex protein FliE